MRNTWSRRAGATGSAACPGGCHPGSRCYGTGRPPGEDASRSSPGAPLRRTGPVQTCRPDFPRPRSGSRREGFRGQEPHPRRRTTHTEPPCPRSPERPASSGCAPGPRRRGYLEDGETAVRGPDTSSEGWAGQLPPRTTWGRLAPRQGPPRPGPSSLEGCRPHESGRCPDEPES
jgi:hypothetical protein